MNNAYGGMPPPTYPGTFQPVMMVPVNGMMMNPNINIYEQQREFRMKMMQERNEYINKRLKENFPVKYVLVHGIILLVMAAIMISMQIVLLVKNSPNAFNSSGIWCGAYLGIVVLMLFLFYSKRTQGYMLGVTLLHMFGMMVCVGCFAANIVVIMINSYTSSTSSLSYSSWSYSQTTTPSPTTVTFNTYLFANIIIVVFAILGVPLMISFVIAIQCILGGCTGNANQRRAIGQSPYGNSMNYGMNSMNTINTMPMNTMPMNQPYMPTTSIY